MSPPQADEHARDVVAYLSHAAFWQPLHVLPSAWLEHGAFAFWFMDMVRPEVLVELGTHSGFAFLAFCQAVQRLGLPTACYAIGVWAEEEHAGFCGREIYDQLAAINAQHYGDFAQLIRSRFDEALSHFGDGAVDLLHIDGRSGYEEARTAFETWHPKLSARAVVLLHDTNVRAPEFGVWRLWAELIRRYPSFEFLHGHGLGVLAVGPETPRALVPLFEASAEQRQAIRAAYAHLGGAISQMRALNEARQECESLAHQHQAECSRLQAEERAVRMESRQLQAVNDELRSERQATLADNDQLRAELMAQTAAHQSTSAHLQATLADNDRLRAELAEQLAHLQLMQNSTFWRATGVLRRGARLLPEPSRVLLRRGVTLLYRNVTGRFSTRLRLIPQAQAPLPPKSALPPPPAGAPAPAPDAGRGRPVTDAVVEYRKVTPRDREAALFVTHSPYGKLKAHVRPFLAALRRHGIHVTLIVAADAAWFDENALRLGEVDTLLVRENRGVDFGAWAHVLQLEPDLFDSETLYLLNDSLIGPFSDTLFEKLIARLRSDPADVIGITESWEYQWHIQSFFLALRRRALASSAFQCFFRAVENLPTKNDVIQRYELQFAPAMRAAGLACSVLFRSGKRDNPALFNWKKLVVEGFPFVKVMALRDKVDGMDSSGWREVLHAQGYNVALADAAIRTDWTPLHSTLPRHLSGAKPEPALLFVGPWNYANGLGVASRSYLSALRRTPYALNLSPIKRPFHIHRRMAPPFDINDFAGPADVAAIHLNPEAWPALLLEEQREAIERARLKIGLWIWETDKLPDSWLPVFETVDAIWAPSRYCHEVFAARTSVPVHVIPYVVTVPPSLPSADRIRRTKEEIGLDPHDRVVLYAFDGSSFLARKNPFALARAFACTGLRQSGWKLVLKTKHLFDLPEQGAKLQEICDDAQGVVLIDRALDRDTMHSLMAMADIYASSHCSEGFGLTVAEAMAMGKVVVATDHGGTRDFLDASCGFPVRCVVKTLKSDHGPYATDASWAHIDEDHLAESLEKAAALIEKGDHSTGEKARARIARDLSPQHVGTLIQQSIRQLLAPARRD